MNWHVILQKDDATGDWAVWRPQLPGCPSAGSTREEALANIREAISLSLEIDEGAAPPGAELHQVNAAGAVSGAVAEASSPLPRRVFDDVFAPDDVFASESSENQKTAVLEGWTTSLHPRGKMQSRHATAPAKPRRLCHGAQTREAACATATVLILRRRFRRRWWIDLHCRCGVRRR